MSKTRKQNRVHDIFGNVIAETAGGGATGAAGTVREYIWLPETEIAPTMDAVAEIDRPVAVFEAVNTVSPILYYVHVDHLNRPAKMTNTAKAVVWDAVWLPFGGVQSLTGIAAINARFPGQWFQTETGLHYNWHRSYDPSLGRYTQPDPLGFVDGPSVYGYAKSSPGRFVDPDGRLVQFLIPLIVKGAALGAGGDIIFQISRNYFWREQDAVDSLECIDIVSTLYSALLGATGTTLLSVRSKTLLERRIALRFLPITIAGKILSPPITIRDILKISGLRKSGCECK